MKKRYQKPQQEVIRMEVQQVICYSGSLNSRRFDPEDSEEEY